jgi:CubicO group peptidase (beta-lactamase class C family)
VVAATEIPAAETPAAVTPEAAATDAGAGDDKQIAAIEDFLDSVYYGTPFQGAVLVAQGENVLLSRGYGMANRIDGTRNEPDTKFRLGSLTKPFTAVAVLMLVEEGALGLEDAACAYLADCPQTWEEITIHDLLAHTSGIPEITMLPDFPVFKMEATTPSQTLARLSDLPLDFAPGRRWTYSNSNYIALGAIIEQVSGQSYETFVEERIFGPLGMTNSGYDHNDDQTAVGYTPDGSTAEFIDMTLPHAAGALYSTVEDLYRFDRALYTDALLSEAMREHMFAMQAQIVPGDETVGYGYGWIILIDAEEAPPGKVVLHSGAIEGFAAGMMRLVDQDAVVIALGNVEGRNPDTVVDWIAQRLFGAR